MAACFAGYRQGGGAVLRLSLASLPSFGPYPLQRPPKGRFKGERDDFATQAHLGMVVL